MYTQSLCSIRCPEIWQKMLSQLQRFSDGNGCIHLHYDLMCWKHVSSRLVSVSLFSRAFIAMEAGSSLMVIKISLTEKQQGGGSPAAKTHWPKACPPTQGSGALCGQERWLKCCCWTISFVPEAFTPPPSLPNGSWLSLCSLCCCFLSPSPKQSRRVIHIRIIRGFVNLQKFFFLLCLLKRGHPFGLC